MNDDISDEDFYDLMWWNTVGTILGALTGAAALVIASIELWA